MTNLDPRLTPARPDLAARHLPKARSQATRFVDGDSARGDRRAGAGAPQSVARRAARYRGAEGRARHRLRDDRRRLVLGPARIDDGYVGWLPANALAAPGAAPTHKVVGPAHAGVSRPPTSSCRRSNALSLGARLAIARIDGALWRSRRRRLRSRAACCAARPCRSRFRRRRRTLCSARPISGAARPSFGLDCSGLVQVSLQACGHRLPARQRHAGARRSARGSAGGSVPASAARRSDLLEGPCRHRARRCDDRARQRVSHGGGDRARGGGRCAHQRRRVSEVTSVRRGLASA